jgi:hypothetical protein
MSSNVFSKFVPVAVVGNLANDSEENYSESEGQSLVGLDRPAAMLLNQTNSIVFDSTFVAASLISLYEAFLSHIPENVQVQFEQEVKELFDKMFEVRHEYMQFIPFDENTKKEDLE